MTLGIIFAIIFVILLFGVMIYNRLVRLRALVREGFSGITVQLRRRADLIPNLVETVKGYATHEKATFEAITEARGAMTGASGVAATAAADAHMTGLIGRLFAVAEAYPELRASENFQQLQGELSTIERRASGRPALLQRHRARPQHPRPVVPRHAVRRPARLHRSGFYKDEDPAIQSAPKIDFKG